jgi:hypothetical protein
MPHTYTQPMIGQGVTLGAAAAAYAALQTSATPGGAAPTPVVPFAWIKDVKAGFANGVLEWKNLAQGAVRRMPTQFDGDALSGSLQYLPGETTQETFLALFVAKTIVYWVVTLPDTSTIEFNGFVSKLSPAVGAPDEEIDADFEISVDGFVHVTPVAT